ncbi:GNAT family N-acetyltransferase [Clostridium grantii]|uniref:GNAT family N-acetyltransferase n=1 Tax=Clostridium grantii TaxID=40575 RepID=UPI001356423D|nr:GNAT family N-acetyltransferase [Clostridium grantii]
MEEEFENPKKVNLIYEYYLLCCANYSEYLEILVDEQDNVKGLIFGSIEDKNIKRLVSYKLKGFTKEIWAFYNLILGNFGELKEALTFKRNIDAMDKLGESYAEEFDSEITLFMVSPELRGMGYGKRLMDRYIKFCKQNKLYKIFLWTELGCTFTFYEKYGFKLYKKFYHENLTKGNKKQPNGLIYTYTIN